MDLDLSNASNRGKQHRALAPSFTISGYRASFTSMTDDPTALAQMESVTDGQRMAGLPES